MAENLKIVSTSRLTGSDTVQSVDCAAQRAQVVQNLALGCTFIVNLLLQLRAALFEGVHAVLKLVEPCNKQVLRFRHLGDMIQQNVVAHHGPAKIEL